MAAKRKQHKTEAGPSPSTTGDGGISDVEAPGVVQGIEDDPGQENSTARSEDSVLDMHAASDAEGDETRAENDVAKVAKLAEERSFLLDQLQRARAELANYRRRTEEERGRLTSRVTCELFKELLPVVDDLHKALAVEPSEAPPQQLFDGLALIADKVDALLRRFAIEVIPTVGEQFDPRWHEAMVQLESAEHEPGEIMGELERGYRMGDGLVRAARVSVAKAPKRGEEEAS